MIISNDKLKKIIFGAYRFEETNDGYLQPMQHTESQVEYFKNHYYADVFFPRCTCCNAKTIEFCTSATAVSFEYKYLQAISFDTVELEVNGVITDKIDSEALKNGSTVSFNMPEGEKSVVIYLPIEMQFLIKNFSINAEYTTVSKNENVLVLGDSITQGYGPLRGACTYINVANRLLNYNIINQGIGGYYYDEYSLEDMPGYKPDKIIVAFGTNHYDEPEFQKKVPNFYKRLNDIYGTTPVLCITPLWRPDLNDENYNVFVDSVNNIKKICSQYPNIKVVDGFKLVPHLSDYFTDNVHPNALGCEVYGRNLVEEIRKIKF